MEHTNRHHKTIIIEWRVPFLRTIDYSHLRQLGIFSTVAEAGSFAAAARKLHTSRSRVSEQIAALETDLGVRLLQRSTRQLQMTNEGLQVYEQARKFPEILQSVEAVTKPQVPAGRVTITMNYDIASKYVLPVLDEFQLQYPEVKLDLVVDDARLDMISEQIDLAIRVGIPRDESLVARVMHEERFAIFASPGYLQKVGKPESVKELEQHQWVSLKQAGYGKVLRLRQKNKSVEIRPTRFLSCNSPLIIQQMVVRGLGLGLLLPTTVREEIVSGQLIQLLSSLRSENLVFSLVYPSRRQVPLRTRVVIDYLLAAKIFG